MVRAVLVAGAGGGADQEVVVLGEPGVVPLQPAADVEGERLVLAVAQWKPSAKRPVGRGTRPPEPGLPVFLLLRRRSLPSFVSCSAFISSRIIWRMASRSAGVSFCWGRPGQARGGRCRESQEAPNGEDARCDHAVRPFRLKRPRADHAGCIGWVKFAGWGDYPADVALLRSATRFPRGDLHRQPPPRQAERGPHQAIVRWDVGITGVPAVREFAGSLSCKSKVEWLARAIRGCYLMLQGLEFPPGSGGKAGAVPALSAESAETHPGSPSVPLELGWG